MIGEKKNPILPEFLLWEYLYKTKPKQMGDNSVREVLTKELWETKLDL